MVKNLPAMRETWVRSLGWEDALEEDIATCSSILAWRIPWTEGFGGLQSMGSQRVRHNRVTKHIILQHATITKGFPCGSDGKESSCNAEDLGSIPGLGRSPGEGKSYPLQYSGLDNSMDYIVHEVAKSWTQLSNFHFLSVWKRKLLQV